MQRSFVYDHYYRYQEITDILKGYAEKYPALTRLSSIGQTPQGRSIWLLEVTDTAAGAFEDKPAYYMEANIHAGEVTGSMVVMYFLDTLFSNLSDPAIWQLLERYTI